MPSARTTLLISMYLSYAAFLLVLLLPACSRCRDDQLVEFEQRLDRLELLLQEIHASVIPRDGLLDELASPANAIDASSDSSSEAPHGEITCTPSGGIMRLTDTIWSITPADTAANFTPACLSAQARITPSYKGRRAFGLRLYDIEPGGWFDQLGLRNGDIVLAINQVPLRSRQQALELFDTLALEATIDVELSRRAHRVTLQYRIQ